ncbi:hypothetical protein [Brevundimonas aurifodinae]|uniref:Glycerophosphoryl diester phosphodiesterase membrane domain-containing protein n=2 Tax=Brevundimonas TaxID=41275 RepID=A0ABV1NQM1_9CAUL|nr:MAG: hypothetical protein B7Z01_09215 [Brevundimonas subvibrioides]
MRFSATEAAFEGFRIVRRNPLAIVFWGLAYVVFFVAFFALVGGQLAGVIAQAEALQGGEPDVSDLQALGQSYFTILGLGAPLGLLLSAVLSAGVARAVLNPSQKAFGYLRLGPDELRVLAVNLILSIALGVGFFVLAMIVGVAAGVVAQGNQGAGVLVGVLLGLAFAVLAIWIAVRLSLAVPLTMAEKRIAPFASFGVTKGHFWPLLGMAVIAFIMSILVSLLGSVIALPIMMFTGGGLAQLAGLEGQSTAAILQTAGPGLLAWGVVNAIVSALQLAVLYAPFAAAYRDIKGPPHA